MKASFFLNRDIKTLEVIGNRKLKDMVTYMGSSLRHYFCINYLSSVLKMVINPSPASLGIQSSPSKQNSAALFFFLGVIVVLLILMILLFVLWKIIKPDELTKLVGVTKRQHGKPDFFSGNLRIISYFDFHTLRKADKNFYHGNLLGRGGFGPVYQEKLEDGTSFAVKKLSVGKSQQGESEFLAEVRLITSIQHKNLVRLLGCCSDNAQRLLVYEYMKNRSLDFIAYGITFI
ncbi:G-type lectin S-receptor-like serine/threonine-protein kinase At1g61390 [Actinidia eriantha]|uniref:G-type lectin S-receptor-like serine/threonine-protein kinase At1g61390 n=1 Tax=Actinidia eriantha TaxID=165200 RepID=UPI00258ABBD8|nr:G-type lectin S-receptor-like serine/threonine-protein kinase At1g61390 [Actinidia eriantha]